MIKNMLYLPDLKQIKADIGLKKSFLPLLEKNQIVDAKVLKLVTPSKAELLILGKKMVADISANLTKGDFIQLKVTEPGQFSILKIIPEKVISEGVKPTLTHSISTSNTSNIHKTSALDAASLGNSETNSLPRLSSAIQSFVKNEPFEGFTKLAKFLFPNMTDNSPDSLPDSVIDKNINVKKGADSLANSSPSSENENRNIVRKEPELVKSLSADKQISSDKTTIPDKFFVTDKDTFNSQIEQSQTDKFLTIPDKELITHQTDNALQNIQDSHLTDKVNIKDLLMSIALKSEEADLNFLPKLIHKSGILLEKKLSDIVKNSLEALPKSVSNTQIDSPSLLQESLTNKFLSNAASLNESSSNHSQTQPLFNINTLIQDDIKGTILKLIASLGGTEAISSENSAIATIQIFSEYIQNLENVQLLNNHLSESGKYIIPFPFFSGDQFSFGQLLIDLGQKDKENQTGSSKENSLLRISLFLEMTNLGPIRADFSVLKDNITGGFQVSDEETAIFFRQMLPELKKRLQIHDYNVHRIECKVVESEKLTEKTIINELLKSKEHGFSVMI